MNTFLGFGKQYVERHSTRRASESTCTSGGPGARKRRTPLQALETPRKKPTRLAIGMEGGFDLGEEKFEYDEDVKIVICRITWRLPGMGWGPA